MYSAPPYATNAVHTGSSTARNSRVYRCHRIAAFLLPRPFPTAFTMSTCTTTSGAYLRLTAKTHRPRHAPAPAAAAVAPQGRGQRRLTAVCATDLGSAARNDTPAPASVALPRRTALVSSLAAWSLAPALTLLSSPRPAAAAAADELGTQEFDFKSYKLTVPGVYEEVQVPLKDPATGRAFPETQVSFVGQLNTSILEV